jgi:hypothetical protein
MTSKRSGRRPKYNAEVHAAIIRHLRLGAFKVHAAQAAGISIDALEQWLKLGRAGDRRYAEFAIEVDKAMAEDAIRKTAVISTAALKGHVGDWRAAAWDLERRYPKLYGRQGQAAVGVTIDQGDDETTQRQQVVFYIPENFRRPVESDEGD